MAPGPMVPRPFRVAERRQDTDDTWTLVLEPDGGDPFPRFHPGQFNMLYAFGAGEVPISICCDPGAEGPLEHTVRAVGKATEAICAMREGDSIGVRGPFGSGWPVDAAEGRDLLVVAGGVGLAPLRPAILAAVDGRERFNRVIVLYGGRTPEQLLYPDEIESWRGAGVEVGVTVDTATHEWSGNVGVVTRLFDEARLDPERSVALLCGPEVMMRFAIEDLVQRGLSRNDAHISIERNMKCAVTWCGRCQFGPTFACREGPVLRFADIERFFAVREI